MSMRRPIIEVTGLAKSYQLGSIGATSLKDEVERFWRWVRGGEAKQKQGDVFAENQQQPAAFLKTSLEIKSIAAKKWL